ncbi:DUF4349 domain-containing protein [Virgibacillus halodenitrificans]|jgi:hypothetical protein|uniref:DUF4349 domain-containing protein n=1 Tax=Virgibacillus halodenitrificans TaxID=1482 RepID=UPI00076189E5|nr:DUF4349 domain-containing protein [Virgibacillus halodenitrificans]MEC2158495.1 DUF4349 domain-containing protein [Virgibacillus halodenitrificans]
MLDKRLTLCLFVAIILIILSGCSNESENGNKQADSYMTEEADRKITEESKEGEATTESTEDASIENSENKTEQQTPNEQNPSTRKIIYTANLEIEVNSYEKALKNIQKKVEVYQGYIVESTMFEEEENKGTSGFITVRVPQEKFREFIQLVEDGSENVLSSSISGQDVTEEYVDLESRLRSKQVVEERLLSYMKKAEKTEDLLAISKDLASVQEEIDQIKGRMKYLENKSELATITIHMTENNLTISGEDLNTWDKTKQQLLKSLNWLLTAVSGFIIFFVGNLPIILVTVSIAAIVLIAIRKLSKSNKDNS